MKYLLIVTFSGFLAPALTLTGMMLTDPSRDKALYAAFFYGVALASGAALLTLYT